MGDLYNIQFRPKSGQISLFFNHFIRSTSDPISLSIRLKIVLLVGQNSDLLFDPIIHLFSA